MSKIEKIELLMIDLAPKVRRQDAIQSFVSQETPIVRLYDSDGLIGTGYSYTIGTGGSSIIALLKDHLLPQLIGCDPQNIEAIWRKLYFSTHATTVGAITSLAMAAIDTALWDLRCRRANMPLYQLAGGAKENIQIYTTEGGWLHKECSELVDDALAVQAQGFGGSKIKVGRKHIAEDIQRLRAVREAVGDRYEIMTDGNQAFAVDEAIRRARLMEPLDIAWFEEPMVAHDIEGHKRLSASTSVPIAVGESIYSPLHFREYLQRGACSVVQADVARVGGITPWLKIAHLAETFNVTLCPHFLMELHVSLCCAVPNSRWVEYIPQLQEVTHSQMSIDNGMAAPSKAAGIGIDWDWERINKRRLVSVEIT
ncbi:MAG: mandelate racemase/muconate lactonizing enzyme family protein [Oceanospirillaceae bacterium]|nr:mandelate racemase/muconate lactonizing enzyme family protein [Oceanospirillaceae bacterium]